MSKGLTPGHVQASDPRTWLTFRSAERMKIVVWHGYLLSGTGSNIYTRALVREWGRAGHEVVVVCQEPQPELHDLGGARVLRPELPDRLLPVFVLDRYAGLQPKLLQETTDAERRRYVEANVAVVRAELPADLVFANHVLLGAPVGAASGARFAVKAHGSELGLHARQRDPRAVGEGDARRRGGRVRRL